MTSTSRADCSSAILPWGFATSQQHSHRPRLLGKINRFYRLYHVIIWIGASIVPYPDRSFERVFAAHTCPSGIQPFTQKKVPRESRIPNFSHRCPGVNTSPEAVATQASFTIRLEPIQYGEAGHSPPALKPTEVVRGFFRLTL